MIYGIGTDIIEVDRFQKYTLDSGFIKKYFTRHEIEYCAQFVNWQERIAGFFAAKEAFAKAFQSGIRGEILLHRIEVHHTPLGAPYLEFADNIKKLLTEKGVTKSHLSLSHTHKLAVAFVILERV